MFESSSGREIFFGRNCLANSFQIDFSVSCLGISCRHLGYTLAPALFTSLEWLKVADVMADTPVEMYSIPKSL